MFDAAVSKIDVSIAGGSESGRIGFGGSRSESDVGNSICGDGGRVGDGLGIDGDVRGGEPGAGARVGIHACLISKGAPKQHGQHSYEPENGGEIRFFLL